MQRNFLLPSLLNLAVFILLEAASLILLTRNEALQRTWVASMGHTVSGSVWGLVQKVNGYFTLSGTNRQLVQENFELQQELASARQALRSLGADSLRLEGIPPEFSQISAEIVKLSHGKQHNYFIINRGYEDGIREKSGVITHKGVVGIIDAVSARHAYAFSLQNKDLSISARLGKEGSSGLLVWDGIHSNRAILKEIPLQDQFQRGDTVFTSGHSLLFPPDIPLGVTDHAKVVNGTTTEISVTLFQDFSALRYVTVVHNSHLDEIEEFTL